LPFTARDPPNSLIAGLKKQYTPVFKTQFLKFRFKFSVGKDN
jgi:hypothetical protein